MSTWQRHVEIQTGNDPTFTGKAEVTVCIKKYKERITITNTVSSRSDMVVIHLYGFTSQEFDELSALLQHKMQTRFFLEIIWHPETVVRCIHWPAKIR